MKTKFFFLVFLVLLNLVTFAQDFNTNKLDELFNSLEKRHEAMGSITISRNGQILYRRAFGHRYVSEDEKILADNTTNYRIWSITKTYTATMILQLVEEGKLSLETTLDHFYPELPNAKFITIENMLDHKSGLHDFTQNETSEGSDSKNTEPLTHEFMVSLIGTYEPNFYPNDRFQYSNSNYLLLGYIIETLDSNLYEVSLKNRISSKIGLTSTYFGVNALDKVENKAFSYKFDGRWKPVDEGEFSGLIPAGAGGIVSTPSDMAKFIEALFNGKLISETNLNKMLDGEDFYKRGMMRTQFELNKGYGHTGGYIASESSLYYYPKDSLTIAYATNGIVLRKEEILNHVLEIYHDIPFAVSMNRSLLALITLGIGLLMFIGFRLKSISAFNSSNLILLGLIISILFWFGVMVAGFLYYNYNHISDGISILDSFYSNSGTFMSSVQLIIALLSIPFLHSLYRACKKLKMNFLPILPIVFVTLSMAGSSIFPFPNKLYAIFANIVILSTLGPLLAVLLWRKKPLNKMRIMSATSLLLMVTSIGFLIGRSSVPAFVHDYFGLIQRLLFLGLTLWLISLSLYFGKAISTKKNSVMD